MEKVHLEKHDYPLVLTAQDIKEILNVSQSVAYEVMNREDFPLLKVKGKIKRVSRDKFFEWMEGDL